VKYRDLLKILKEDGWYEVRTNGSHHIMGHPTKANTFPLAYHSLGHDVPTGLKEAILKQARIK
jgi:predicted RNA binding protein YcfA (HicA-like mRNA interferase family)